MATPSMNSGTFTVTVTVTNGTIVSTVLGAVEDGVATDRATLLDISDDIRTPLTQGIAELLPVAVPRLGRVG